MSLTDNEIVRALECCLNDSCYTSECFFFKETKDGEHCQTVAIKYALDLINRLQSQNNALIAGQETLQKALAEKIEESENQSQNFKVLVSDHKTLQQSFDNLEGLYEAQKARVEKAKEKSIYFAKELQKAKENFEAMKKSRDRWKGIAEVFDRAINEKESAGDTE